MHAFVQWRGEVPPEAKRLEDFEAREHTATWLRFNIGEGIAAGYVIGFQCGEAWWGFSSSESTATMRLMVPNDGSSRRTTPAVKLDQRVSVVAVREPVDAVHPRIAANAGIGPPHAGIVLANKLAPPIGGMI
jgi:hypothetical protein